MAFAFTVEGYVSLGNKILAYGQYSNSGGSTGGNINTRLFQVERLWLQPIAAAIGNNDVVNTTFPISPGDAIPIVTVANRNGLWFALGT